ncbi:hypothetical protein GCM10010912_14560 [Paenibacillus albidus]|uniref:Uncharacterized protein n=1 Tax=Paenibacillus albidus TaxID=2041023 RepID=A0A917C3R0_9BACL|nr:hypothetical protein GCM10010912_14560 [Paenibacillus albidus]
MSIGYHKKNKRLTYCNFVNKTISFQHTVTPVYFEGKEHMIENDRTKAFRATTVSRTGYVISFSGYV